MFKDYNLLSLGFKQCKSYEREPGADEHEYPETIESEIIAITQDADLKGVEIDIIEQFNRGKLR